ncbi:hypothetical protein I4F81_003934 [Pyropia yezoensis]|uniref:Uncharacterized protein n=1 Tax=Pyropia yezoensis TaxID=2788 RepID=A0ACC3BUC5_PYRYE|nr:hypothetical protein I4F81_003934 [Neopyropia yezoensis]
MDPSFGLAGGQRARGCRQPLSLFLLLAVLAAVGGTHGGVAGAPRRPPACTRTLCAGVAAIPHPRLQPWSTGPPTTVDVPLHLTWPARRAGRVPLVILLHGALVRSRDYAGLVSTLGRRAVVAAPEYAARNFTLPPGAPPADPLFDTFLATVATKGKRPECPSQGVFPTARLVQSVMDAFAETAPPTAGAPRPHPVLAAAAAAADVDQLVLYGHSAGAASALALASGLCASADLPPPTARLLCEGAGGPPAGLAGVAWYSGAVFSPGGAAQLPPGVWGLGLDGDTPAAVEMLAAVTAGLAPTPGGKGRGVLLTAGLDGAGHYGVAGPRWARRRGSPADQGGRPPPGGPPLCAAPNAGDANFTTTPRQAAAVVRRVAAVTAAAIDAYLPFPLASADRGTAATAATLRRRRGCAVLAALARGALPGFERVTFKGTPRAAACPGVAGN